MALGGGLLEVLCCETQLLIEAPVITLPQCWVAPTSGLSIGRSVLAEQMKHSSMRRARLSALPNSSSIEHI